MVVRTSIPASSRTITSSQRLVRSDPGILVWGNSSTAQISGCRARIAARVHFLKLAASIFDLAPGNDFQPFDLGDGVLAPVRLEVSDRHIVPVALQLLRLFEHLVGLADAGRVSRAECAACPVAGAGSLISGPLFGNTRTSMPSASRISRSTGFGFPAAHPSGLLAVADKNLGDPLLGGEFQNGGGRIFGMKDLDLRVRFAGALQISIQDGLIGRR